MSIRHANQPQFPLRGLREGPAAPWVRPADWPGLPWILDSEQAMVGLVAVNDTDNEAVAVLCVGAYTVDWGDGNSQNVATNTKVEHVYNYSTLATAVTSRGYKTAIVKITPQAGQNLTTINLQQRPAGFQTLNNQGSLWLDIQINAANVTTLTLGGTTIRHTSIERLHIRSHACTTLNALCQGFSSLRSLPSFDTANVTSVYNMMSDCAALQEAPFFDFQNATASYNTFAGCISLGFLHPYNLSKSTSIYNFANACYSLRKFPQIVLGPSADSRSFVQNCVGLREVDAIDLSQATNLGNAFVGAATLTRIKAVGMKVTFTLASCSLSATALNEVFTNLASGVTGQTITVTGNPGAAPCDTSIATAKGWTVVT